MDIRHAVKPADAAYWKNQIRCQAACPVHTDARGYVRAIAEGDFEKAYLIARGPNPLASICGWICGAPCESACRRGEIDQPIAIRALKRAATDRFGPYRADHNGATASQIAPEDHLAYLNENIIDGPCEGPNELIHLVQLAALTKPRPSGPTVAIIGSGPAGLACAHDLALLGMRPTIFEAESIPAGMLYLGVPEYRLPRDLITAEIGVIQALGVEIKCGVEIGKDILLSDLRDQFAAVVVSVGCKRSRGLQIPGSDAAGVIGGVEFLRSIALQAPIPLGEKVVVIGGGNVAYDVSRAVVRQESNDVSRQAMRLPGKREVQIVCLESLEEMPADIVEIREGEEEGVVRKNGWGPVEILTEGGADGSKVIGIRFQRCIRVIDELGKFNPLFDGNDTIDLPADTVILSVGQAADLTFFESGEDGIALTENRQIQWDEKTQMTSGEGVFIAGDVAYGPRLAIHAVASGKKAARGVYEYLTGTHLHEDAVQFHVELPHFHREPDLENRSRTEMPTRSIAERLSNPTATIEIGYTDEQAMAEAGRCLDCGVDTVFNQERCVLCGACTEVCPTACLQLRPIREIKSEEPFVEHDVESHYHVQKNTIIMRDKKAFLTFIPQARIEANEDYALFKDEDVCIRCGKCAQVCPTKTISMSRIEFRDRWTVSP